MTVLLILAVFSAGLVFLLDGRPLARQFRFLVHKGRYEAAVREILAGRTPRRDTDLYTIDSGPPLRVAFHWPGGILDNWNGVVYDPTGLVLKVNSRRPKPSNRDDPDPEVNKSRMLFGGDLYYSEPLGGDWYLCGFT